MSRDRKANWVKTDDDSVQYRREAVELEQDQEKVVELYQLQIVCDITKVSDPDPKIYAIAHDFVYLSEVDVNKGVVLHRLGKVYRVQDFHPVACPLEHLARFQNQCAFWVCDHE